MNFYSTLPVHILRNKNLSATTKLLYMEITSRVGVDGKMKFNLHALAMSQGIQHYTVKSSLNDLVREKLIWRIGGDISLSPPDSQEFKQLEIDLEFVGEVIRTWNKSFKRELPSGIKQTPALTGVISDCLISFTKDELIESIGKWQDYCSTDKWWGHSDNALHRSNAFKFFSNSERINQSLNYKGRGSDIVIQRDESEDSDLLK